MEVSVILLKEKGITIEVLAGKNKLISEKDGYLGENLADLQLKCWTEKKLSSNPLCFSVDGQNHIALMHDRSSDPAFNLYLKKIPVDSVAGILTTKPSTNNIRLAVPGRQGKFEIWEIAIVSQDGLFFLTKQMPYRAQFFKDGEKVSCPFFENPPHEWPQLVEVLKPLVQDKKLLPISMFSPPPAPITTDLQEKQAVVEWWSLRLQRGAVVLQGGTRARVHWKSLPINMNGGLRKLTAGQLVSFQKLPPVTNKESGFNLEIREVTPL